MSVFYPSLPPSGLLAAAGGLGGDGGDDNPHRRHLPSTHAVDANPAFPDEEENPDPNPNDGNNSDPASAGAARWRKKNRAVITPPFHCAVCRKEFANPKALHGHMRCHPDRSWRGITPPALLLEREKEVAASLVMLSGLEGARERRYPCSRCGRGFDTRQALGGHRASHRSVRGCHAKSEYEGRNASGEHGARKGTLAGHMGKGGIQVKITGARSRRERSKTSAEEKEAEEVAAVEAAAERRGLLVDLNLPAPPEDKNDDSSSGMIDLNEKLPGQDDE